MPVFKVDIQKSRGGIFWTNRYLVETATLSAAAETIEPIFEAEQLFHALDCQFVSGRASDNVPANDQFIIVPLSGGGAITVSGNPLPGFNCVRVDFSTGIGRPCRKYYRTYVGEAEAAGYTWALDYYNIVSGAMLDLLANVPQLCDPGGEILSSQATQVPIQMRQLRRGSKRKVTPVIPVAP